MLAEDKPFDLVAAFFQLLQQLLLPNWNDLIKLVPYTLIAALALVLLWLAMAWRGSAARNKPRLRPTLSASAPPAGVHVSAPSRWPFVAPIGLALLLFGLVLPVRDAQGHVALPVNPLLVGAGLVVGLIGVVGWLREAMREWRVVSMASDHHPGAMVAQPSMAMTVTTAADNPSQPALATQADAAARREPPPGVHMPGPSPWPFFAPIALTVLFYGVIFNPALIIAGILLGMIAATGWLLDAGRELRSTEEVGHAVPRTTDPRAAWPRRLVPVFFGVIVVAVLVVLMPVGFAFLNGLKPASASPTPVAVPAVPEITASSAISFSTKDLVVPAGRKFDLVFHNTNAGVPHNVTISDSAANNTYYLKGDTITGVADATYHVDALSAGDYYFFCSVHPNMNGTVHAVAETAPAGGSGSTPAPSTTP